MQQAFDPLIDTCRQLGSRHLSLFGSALRKPLAKVADVDVHVVIPRMDRMVYAELFAAAEKTGQALSIHARRSWRVEMRHGPFKPSPDARPVLQLHLLVDDETSLARLPGVVRAQRTATGHLLLGHSLLEIEPRWGSYIDQLGEAQAELHRWREAIRVGAIAFRHWVFDPYPGLVENLQPATTAWERRCLLRGAAVASDLHYFNVVGTGARAAGLAAARGGSLLAQIEKLSHPWQSLMVRWEQVKERAVTAIEERLEHLARIADRGES